MEWDGGKEEEESLVGYDVKMVKGLILMGRLNTILAGLLRISQAKTTHFAVSGSQCKRLCCQVASSQLDAKLFCSAFPLSSSPCLRMKTMDPTHTTEKNINAVIKCLAEAGSLSPLCTAKR